MKGAAHVAAAGSVERRAAARAGVAYTLIVFVIALVLGTIRVTLLAPRLGPLVPVVIEAPIILAVSWFASSWCTSRFGLGGGARARLLMGLVAFLLLMLLEVGISVWIFGETPAHYIARYATPAGVLGLAMQVGFALIPRIQSSLHDSPD